MASLGQTSSRQPSRLELLANPKCEIPALLKIGEYTIYPLEYCSEDEAAELFCKMAARGNPGNPVLQGRPAADLKLLGRAMYRKANRQSLGNIAFHEGVAVAIGCSWDVADGGVWEGSGLEMPASMQAHAALGKAAFDSLPKSGKKQWYCGFYGVAPKHNARLFSYLGTAGAMVAYAQGFEELFIYSLLSGLQNREGIYSRKSTKDETHWKVPFAEIEASPAVSAELKELDGVIQLAHMSLGYSLEDDYMTGAAKMVKLKTAADLRIPCQEIADRQIEWIRQTESSGGVVLSKL